MNVIDFINSKGGVGKSTLTSLYADIMPSENGKLANMIRKVG